MTLCLFSRTFRVGKIEFLNFMTFYDFPKPVITLITKESLHSRSHQLVISDTIV